MEVDLVIQRVKKLQEKLIDVDFLSCVCNLYVLTDGDAWSVEFLGERLMNSEDCDVERPLEDQIIEGMKSIQYYLNTFCLLIMRTSRNL